MGKPLDNATFRIAFKYGVTLKEYYFGTSGGGTLQVSLNVSSSIYIGRNGQTIINENVWSHVVCTYDGSGNRFNVNIYLNGVLDNGTAISSGVYTAMSNTSEPFEIGRYSGGSYANGNINDTSLFNTELTQEQVTEIYNGGIVNDISNLNPLSYWRSEFATWDGSNWTMIDQGSGANNGTSVSMPLTSRTSDVPT